MSDTLTEAVTDAEAAARIRVAPVGSTATRGSARPYAFAPGTAFFALTWTVGLGIARLTGAAAVVLVLGSACAGLIGALIEGRRAVRSIVVTAGRGPTLTTVGERVTVTIDGSLRRHAPRVLRLCLTTDDAERLPLGERTMTERTGGEGHLGSIDVRFPEAGVVDVLLVDVETAGASGLVWWRRRFVVPIEPILVAPRPAGPMVAFEPSSTADPGEGSARLGTSSGDVDGVRPWRDGEEVVGVHWPSTMRAGALIVHDRQVASDTSWLVPIDDDSDAARVRFTLDEGLRGGHSVTARLHGRVSVRAGAPLDRTDMAVHDADDAARLSALLASRPDTVEPARRQPLSTREFHPFGDRRHDAARANPERVVRFTPAARWMTALAAGLALAMLVTALEGRPVTVLLLVVALALGAVVTMHLAGDDGRRPLAVRLGVGIAAVSALAYIAVGASGVGGLLAALRGPLPDLLMLLVVLHGFEVCDRRTMRVHQAIALIVAVYAAGLRIDDGLGWWLAAWGVAFVAAITLTSSPPRSDAPAAPRATLPLPRRRRAAGVMGWSLLGAGCALAILVTVPVPDGPASLGLPALSNGTPVSARGALAGPGGTPSGSSSDDGARGALGQAGGYRGFSETLDTSVRGDLGDEVVMRVRSPEPAFWRGQTFTDFDGRSWTVSPETGLAQQGPSIAVPPTLGDRGDPRFDTDELVQTYFVETELPNVLFAAHRATTVIFDGTVWARPDGALRSDVTLTDGSVYTVVSERIRVTSELLRAQGDVAPVFESFDDDVSRAALAPYLDVPASTSARTLALADELNRPGQSTYDTVLAFERWIAGNTVYDLDAPVPDGGVDAVDDFLFGSQRGFCEQIASALTIMLRSQGVPARLATGYLPGRRDRVSGVWEVRAGDAHAWVEVWFPETGWEAFDPTASVPLAGDAAVGTVGGDLVSAGLASVSSHPGVVGGAVAVGLLAVVVGRIAADVRRRGQRGRWGVLQDRFTDLARVTDDAIPPSATNPYRGERLCSILDLDDGASAEVASVVEALDRAAFDPSWRDTGRTPDYERVATALDSLERLGRRRPRALIDS